IDWAVARAIARDQSVELIGVVGGSIGMIGEAGLIALAGTATEESLQQHADRVAASGVAVTTRVVIGDPVHELASAAKDADLLVLGSDYQGPEGPRARGSHGIRIVAASESPVAVVP